MDDFDDDYFDDMGLYDCVLVDKSRQSAELEALTADYLKRGGRIEQLSLAATGLDHGFITHGQMTSIDKANANAKKRAQVRKQKLISALREALARPEHNRPTLGALCTQLGASAASMRALLIHTFPGDPAAEAMLLENGKRKALTKQQRAKDHGDL